MGSTCGWSVVFANWWGEGCFIFRKFTENVQLTASHVNYTNEIIFCHLFKVCCVFFVCVNEYMVQIRYNWCLWSDLCETASSRTSRCVLLILCVRVGWRLTLSLVPNLLKSVYACFSITYCLLIILKNCNAQANYAHFDALINVSMFGYVKWVMKTPHPLSRSPVRANFTACLQTFTGGSSGSLCWAYSSANGAVA